MSRSFGIRNSECGIQNSGRAALVAAGLWLLFTLFLFYACLYLGSLPEQPESGSAGNARASHWTFDRAAVEEHIGRIRLNPLISPETGRRVSIPDVAQNVVLFVPFGLLGALALGVPCPTRPRQLSAISDQPSARAPRSEHRIFCSAPGTLHGTRHQAPGTARSTQHAALGTRARPVWVVTLLGAGLSVVIETMQLFTVDRITSFTDVLANTGGALTGAVVVVPLAALSQRLIPRVRSRGLHEAPAFYPLVGMIVLLCVSAWWPFDASLDVGGAWSKVKALRLDPWQPGALAVGGLTFVEYALFALITALYLRQIGLGRATSAGVLAVLTGAVFAVGLEASKLLIESRMPGLGGAAMSVAGVVAGVLLSIAFSTDEVGH